VNETIKEAEKNGKVESGARRSHRRVGDTKRHRFMSD